MPIFPIHVLSHPAQKVFSTQKAAGLQQIVTSAIFTTAGIQISDPSQVSIVQQCNILEAHRLQLPTSNVLTLSWLLLTLPKKAIIEADADALISAQHFTTPLPTTSSLLPPRSPGKTYGTSRIQRLSTTCPNPPSTYPGFVCSQNNCECPWNFPGSLI